MYLFDKKINILSKIHRSIAYAIRISLILAMLSAFVNGRWAVMFVSFLVFFLTFLPALIEKNYKIYLPVEFDLIIILFIYATLFLGEVHQYYTRFWWWDIVLHTGSGLVLGFAGFIALYSLYEGKKIRASPGIIATFSFCFAVAVGSIWEIVEFAIDNMFNANMQRSGLVDTMWDLIVDSAGALFTSTIGYVYLKGGKTRIFDKLISRFVKRNPRFFR